MDHVSERVAIPDEPPPYWRFAAPARAGSGVSRFAARVLVASLALQRFAVPLGTMKVQLVGPIGLALAFWAVVSGALVIEARRLRLFLVLVALLLVDGAAHQVHPNSFGVSESTASLLQFVILTSFVVLAFAVRVSDSRFLAQAAGILRWFAWIGIIQFMLQFLGLGVFSFSGLLPDRFLFEEGYNLEIPVGLAGLLKSNGFFLLEPSIFSQAMAVGVILETLTLRRPARIALFLTALLLSFSGTGWLVLGAFIVFSRAGAGGKAMRIIAFVACFIVVAAVGSALVIPDAVNIFRDRLAEFNEPGTSANLRFVTPAYFLRDVLLREPTAILFGLGAGVSERLTLAYAYNINTPIKIIVEYGLPALFAYIGLFLSARRVPRQRAVLAPALVLTFLAGGYQQFPAVLFPIFTLLCVAQFDGPVADGGGG